MSKNLVVLFLGVFFAAFCLVTSSPGNLWAQNGEQCEALSGVAPDYLKNEYAISGWRALAAIVENCSGKMERRLLEERGEPWIIERQCFKIRGNSVRTERWSVVDEESKEMERRSASASNPHYFFNLQSTFESGAENAWELLDVQQQISGRGLNPVISRENDAGPLGRINASHAILGVPLWELIEDESFHVSNVDYITPDRTIVSADFSWKLPSHLAPPRASGIDDTMYGYVEFNTQEYWRIEKLYFRMSYSQNNRRGYRYIDYYLEYANTGHEAPHVTRISMYVSNTGHGKRELPANIVEILDIDFTPVPASEFTLSHYGFPEPVDPIRRIGVLNIVLSVIGILLIALGIFLRWFAMKKT